MKLVLTADLHLGRSSSGLPPSADNLGLPTTSREAWFRIVDLAIREKSDAVLIAGDLVESSTAYYEALGPLIEGFRKLQEEGIDVFAVSGNHDANAFEKIASEVDGMEHIHFVGRRGAWERVSLVRDGAVRLFVDGWSFPAPRHPSNPLEDYALARPENGPVIGLLHADLDASSSPHAPTSLDSLRRCPPHFWLLGHIHKPRLMQGGHQANILYPGSPQAMDFGETGAHGTWLLDTDAGGFVPVQWQVSSIRYEDSIRLQLSDTDELDEIERALLGLSRTQIDGFSLQERHELRCVVHRCTLTGDFSKPQVLANLSSNLPKLEAQNHEGIHFRFQSGLRDETSLPLDIEALERRGGALGELASRYRQLGTDEWRGASWFKDIHTRVVRAFQDCRLAGDGEDGERGLAQGRTVPPDKNQTREWLLVETKKLLVAAREAVT
jgi:DNA repair protein SbcD/Mre11